MAKKILIVDDEQLIVKGLKYSLTQDNYEVDTALDGEEALEKAKQNNYDLILLDLMLPKMSGMEVCREVRGFSSVPIIMLTAKSDDIDKIMGLEYGADDYVTKPFNILEVKARIKAIFRRVDARSAEPVQSPVIESGDLRLDKENRRLSVAGREVNLTSKEFELLDFLVAHPGKVYGRVKLLELIWGKDFPGDERTVDVHVRRLREKIEPNPSEPRYVQTKWGVGYYYQEHRGA
ncbi:MAG: response regulator transcription factor [Lachnospiraceae bacterium]|nr:response regulator transcription factor [Lachnospiraceae bacterium]